MPEPRRKLVIFSSRAYMKKTEEWHLASLGASPTGYVWRRRRDRNFLKSQSLYGKVELVIVSSPLAYTEGDNLFREREDTIFLIVLDFPHFLHISHVFLLIFHLFLHISHIFRHIISHIFLAKKKKKLQLEGEISVSPRVLSNRPGYKDMFGKRKSKLK